MGTTRGAQRKGRCTHNSSNLVFCDLHSCSNSSSSRSSSSVNPPSRSIIVSIEEVAAYLMDQNMGATASRCARGQRRQVLRGTFSVTRFTTPLNTMENTVQNFPRTTAAEQRGPEGTLSTTTLFIMDRSSSAVREVGSTPTLTRHLHARVSAVAVGSRGHSGLTAARTAACCPQSSCAPRPTRRSEPCGSRRRRSRRAPSRGKALL